MATTFPVSDPQGNHTEDHSKGYRSKACADSPKPLFEGQGMESFKEWLGKISGLLSEEMTGIDNLMVPLVGKGVAGPPPMC
jgi:hypothetical protein